MLDGAFYYGSAIVVALPFLGYGLWHWRPGRKRETLITCGVIAALLILAAALWLIFFGIGQ